MQPNDKRERIARAIAREFGIEERWEEFLCHADGALKVLAPAADKKESLVERLREKADVTLWNISEDEIAHSPGWTKSVLDRTAALLNEAADALSSSTVALEGGFADGLCSALGKLLGVAKGTARRWVNGESAPHALGQESVLRAIAGAPIPEIVSWRGMIASRDGGSRIVLIDAIQVGDEMAEQLIKETDRRRRAEILLQATQAAYVRDHEALSALSATLAPSKKRWGLTGVGWNGCRHLWTGDGPMPAKWDCACGTRVYRSREDAVDD